MSMENLFKPFISSPHISLPSTNYSIVKAVTARILTTFRHCNPDLNVNIDASNILTNPYIPMHNYGLDNDKHELIVRIGDTLGSATSFEGRHFSMNPHVVSRYEVIGKLGQGTFGQVFKCKDHLNNREVAIKVLKNKKAYFRQGMLEVTALLFLNKFYDHNKQIVEIYEYVLKENDEYEIEYDCELPVERDYFNRNSLKELIYLHNIILDVDKYPVDPAHLRVTLYDFLTKCFAYDPLYIEQLGKGHVPIITNDDPFDGGMTPDSLALVFDRELLTYSPRIEKRIRAPVRVRTYSLSVTPSTTQPIPEKPKEKKRYKIPTLKKLPRDASDSSENSPGESPRGRILSLVSPRKKEREESPRNEQSKKKFLIPSFLKKGRKRSKSNSGNSSGGFDSSSASEMMM
ncbi:Serine/threonine protein kinase ppk15 [Entamoeba marina]